MTEQLVFTAEHGAAADHSDSIPRRRPVRRYASPDAGRSGLAARVHLRQGDEPLRRCSASSATDVMGYISYSEGFNSGGVATPTIQGVRDRAPVQAADDRDVRDRSAFRSRGRQGALQRDVVRHGLERLPVGRRRVRPRKAARSRSCRRPTSATRPPRVSEFEFTWLPIESLMVNVEPRPARHGVHGAAPGPDERPPRVDERNGVRTCSGYFVHDRLGAHG